MISFYQKQLEIMYKLTKTGKQNMSTENIIGNMSSMKPGTCMGTGNNSNNSSSRPIIFQLIIHILMYSCIKIKNLTHQGETIIKFFVLRNKCHQIER